MTKGIPVAPVGTTEEARSGSLPVGDVSRHRGPVPCTALLPIRVEARSSSAHEGTPLGKGAAMKPMIRPWTLVLLLIAALLILDILTLDRAESQETVAANAVAQPAYDENGHLRLPADYREWIFVGSSLGMSYTEGEEMGHEMFHETLMEPGAYRHFVDTGEFADGTQLVLILHGTDESVLPQRRGRFAAEIHGVEMAVKDFGRFEEGWAYYGFGGTGGIRQTAEAFPKRSCHACHIEHAALDNVFVQFYPMLTEAAGVEVALRRVGDETDTGPGDVSGPMGAAMGAAMGVPAEPEAPQPNGGNAETRSDDPVATASSADSEARSGDGRSGDGRSGDGAAAARGSSGPASSSDVPVVAYAGLDPVMLVEGREEMGKAEIVEDFRGWRYQFASEPNRAAFAADPARYAPQNSSCLMMPGAPLQPDLFAVHEAKVYGFGSVNCREEFESDPAAMLPAPASGSSTS
jgi:YHS domain-containing protein